MVIASLALAWVAVFSMALFIIGLQSYKRAENPKLALVATAFLVFFIKAAILATSLFMTLVGDEELWVLTAMLDTVFLVLIFLGVYKR